MDSTEDRGRQSNLLLVTTGPIGHSNVSNGARGHHSADQKKAGEIHEKNLDRERVHLEPSRSQKEFAMGEHGGRARRERAFPGHSRLCGIWTCLSGALTRSAKTGSAPEFVWCVRVSYSLRLFLSIAEWFQERFLLHSLVRCVAQYGGPCVDHPFLFPFYFHAENFPP